MLGCLCSNQDNVGSAGWPQQRLWPSIGCAIRLHLCSSQRCAAGTPPAQMPPFGLGGGDPNQERGASQHRLTCHSRRSRGQRSVLLLQHLAEYAHPQPLKLKVLGHKSLRGHGWHSRSRCCCRTQPGSIPAGTLAFFRDPKESRLSQAGLALFCLSDARGWGMGNGIPYLELLPWVAFFLCQSGNLL